MPNSTARFTYNQVKQRLLSMPRFAEVGDRAANFALDQIQRFLYETGDFSSHIPTIHVAGTNGKGTVCSMLASVYTKAGYSTGLYTSPHLLDVRERFRIDGEMMSEEDLVAFFEEMDTNLKRHPLTFFELTTVIAFWYFNKKGVDVAIIETGLGGRLDATNILTPRCCVITSIGMDHKEQLGDTLERIAREKAGILKENTPYVLGDINDSANEVIIQYGNGIKARHVPRHTYAQDLTTDVPSIHERCNIELVHTVLQTLAGEFPVSTADFEEGMRNVRTYAGLKGRLEKLHLDRDIYFDGSHNPDGLQALGAYLSPLYDLKNATVVVAMMQDKLDFSMKSFFDLFGKVYFVELNQPRSAKFDDFKQVSMQAKNISTSSEAILELLNESKTQLVLFTGSFYFYSVVSEWMGSHKTTTSN
jgi:dihydrofolate synthase/folylpolyglutamate synthase